MASLTKTTKRKRANRKQAAGRARKRKQAQRSTLSAQELFAGLPQNPRDQPSASG